MSTFTYALDWMMVFHVFVVVKIVGIGALKRREVVDVAKVQVLVTGYNASMLLIASAVLYYASAYASPPPLRYLAYAAIATLLIAEVCAVKRWLNRVIREAVEAFKATQVLGSTSRSVVVVAGIPACLEALVLTFFVFIPMISIPVFVVGFAIFSLALGTLWFLVRRGDASLIDTFQ